MLKYILVLFFLVTLLTGCNQYDPYYGGFGYCDFYCYFGKKTSAATSVNTALPSNIKAAKLAAKNPAGFPILNGTWGVNLYTDNSTCTGLGDKTSSTINITQTVSSKTSTLRGFPQLLSSASLRGRLREGLSYSPIELDGKYRIPLSFSGCIAEFTTTVSDFDQQADLIVNSFNIRTKLNYTCKKTPASNCSATFSGSAERAK